MQLENQLRTEIEFWQDLIETRLPERQGGVMEIAAEAKCLAEQKLALYLEENKRILN